MRAVVVGLGWGRVHVAALREAGVEVVALCARDARAAEAAADGLGVPLGLAGLDRVSDLAADLISVAVPADQHARVIAELPASVPILCEKPAVGLSAPVVLSPGRVAPVWVNYAFAFLEAAALASSAVGALGRVGAVRADSRYDLGVDSRTELGMFFELVVHPWSWLVTLLGAAPGQASAGWAGPALHDDPGMAEPAGTDRDEAVVAIDMACGEVEGRLSCGRRPGMSGIAHEAVIEAARGRVRVGGRYRIGEPWSFRVDVDRGAGWHPLGAEDPGAEGRHPGEDPWYRANRAAIAAVVAAVRGASPDPRLFDWDRALEIDRLAQQRLHDGGWRW